MKNIKVVIDCSGSFLESGKRELQTYLIDTLDNASEGILQGIAEFSFFTWSDNINPFPPKETIPFGGSAHLDCLSEWIASLEDGEIVLVLSDGLFKGDSFAFHQQIKKQNCKVIPYAVGADASQRNLADLSPDTVSHDPIHLLTDISKLCRKDGCQA